MSDLQPRHPTPAWLARRSPTLSSPAGSALIGRDREVESLTNELQAGTRLLTIQGFAGVGKTRLALAVAQRWSELRQPAAVWFVDAALAGDLHDLCDAAAHALNVPLPKAADSSQAIETLAIALDAAGPGLLVLDSVEHLADAARELAEACLLRAEQIQILVTSRSLLGSSAERSQTLKPLSLPDPNARTWEEIACSDAVRLLAERAQAVGSQSLLTENPTVTAQIARRLDGLPLALELAAVQLRVLGPHDLLRRLERRFELLATSNHDVPTRQRTLKAAIDWSWDQLEPWEREALSQLSVCQGDFGVDLAEAIIRPSDPDAPTALAIISCLEAKSLLQAERDSETARHARLRLLESVREYATEKLCTDGDVTEAWRRLADFLLTEAEQAAEEVWAHGAIAPLRWLARERRHLVALHRRAARGARAASRGRDATTAVRAALCVDPLLAVRGPASLRLELLSAACSLAALLPDRPDLASQAHLARVAVEHDLCRPGRAIEHERHALAFAHQAADPKLLARTLAELARASSRTRRRNEAVSRADEALLLARAHGDRLAQAQALTTRGIALWELDRWDEATKDSLAALELARELDHASLQGRALGNLAGLAIDFGNREDYLELSKAALACFRRAGDRQREAICHVNLAAYHRDSGEPQRSRECLLTAQAILAEVGDRDVTVKVEGSLGCLEQELRGVEHGHRRLQRAAQALAGTGFWLAETFVLARLGAGLAARGRVEQAGDAFGRARASCLVDDDRRINDALALLEAHLELAQARALDAGGDSFAADTVRSRVSELLQVVEARWQGLTGTEARALGAMRFEGGPELRAAQKLLRTALAEPVSMRRTYRAPPVDALVIGEDACWFRPPRGEQVSLGKRKSLRRILEALVQERRDSPGHATLPLSLVEVGWPGERILHSAATNRIHVAIAGLRRLGLERVLLKTDSGYLLDPRVPLAEGYRIAVRIEAVETPY